MMTLEVTWATEAGSTYRRDSANGIDSYCVAVGNPLQTIVVAVREMPPYG